MLVSTLLESKPKEVITAKPSTTIDEAMDLLIKNKISCLPILEQDGKLVGIISDKDIFKKVYETKGNYHPLKVEDVMSTNLIVGLPTDTLEYIAGIMDKNWIRHIPIVEGDNMIGLVSEGDIIKTMTQNKEIENRYLTMYLEGMHRRDMSGD
ncbi:MAG: CBS domain-containing protein [candidate division Zixibacteria bacterium]|nr:CBS domain-containing protein [candidate division Zixibacteria bacterium]